MMRMMMLVIKLFNYYFLSVLQDKMKLKETDEERVKEMNKTWAKSLIFVISTMFVMCVADVHWSWIHDGGNILYLL